MVLELKRLSVFFSRASKSATSKGFDWTFSACYEVGAELMEGTLLPVLPPSTICFGSLCGVKGSKYPDFVAVVLFIWPFTCGKRWPFGPLLNPFTLNPNIPLLNRRTFSSHVSMHMNRFQETYPDWKEASGSQAAPFNFHSSSSPPSAPACSLALLHL